MAGNAALGISDSSMGDYLAGIWSKHVVSELAWGRMFSPLISVTEYVAPTWSWASVNVPMAIDDVREGLASDLAWAQKYRPELVSHRILDADHSNPYGNVLSG
ncbi:HET domain protein [Penicillium angulare]|uniref:HET domain protein n=1 Tax=Penicillium angulare TaxID=116970 RepID=UPI00253FDD93|nr:HET domain protein [Penicillium angulare]KAJ5261213.1 HET domain protein [Penicillium angulare]